MDWLQILKNYIDTIETLVGTNSDAAGTTTLFARVRQIVDTYLADATIGLAAIEALVDDLESAIGAIEGGTTLHNKLTAARATLLDQITALRMAELDAVNIPADIDTLNAAVGAIEGATTLHNKLTVARAALIDEITALRMAELDAANLPTDIDNIKAALYLAAGIAAWLGRALPANGVSISEAIQYIAELKPHFSTPTAIAHTTSSAAPTEDVVFTTAAIGPGVLHGVIFLNNLVAGDDITIRVYQYNTIAAAYQLLSEQQFAGAQNINVWKINEYVDSVAHIQVRTLRTSATNRLFSGRYSILQQPVA